MPLSNSDAAMMDLERLTREHAQARTELEGIKEEIAEQVRGIKRKYQPQLKGLAVQVIASRDALADHIDYHRELFKRPKTRILHRLSVGVRKQPDKHQYDADAIIPLIEERLPEQADLLIDTVKRPVHAAIKQLPHEQQALIGVLFMPGEDVVAIKPVASSVDRWIDALVKEVDKQMDAD